MTILGSHFEWSTQRLIEDNKWSKECGRAKGNSGDAKSINCYLELLRHKVFLYQRELMLEGKAISVQAFRVKCLGISTDKKMILEVFDDHNKKMSKLVGIEFAEATMECTRLF